MNGFTMCSQCIYWEECESKESRDGCYFGVKESVNYETVD